MRGNLFSFLVDGSLMAKGPTVKELSERFEELEEEIRELRGTIRDLKAENKKLQGKMDTRIRREKEVRRILEIDSRNRKGAGTVVRELTDRTNELEEYLLSNTKRIEFIRWP